MCSLYFALGLLEHSHLLWVIAEDHSFCLLVETPCFSRLAGGTVASTPVCPVPLVDSWIWKVQSAGIGPLAQACQHMSSNHLPDTGSFHDVAGGLGRD